MEDTIAAVATPPGTGGVAVIRISGKDALHVLERVFSYTGTYEHGAMVYGNVLDKGEVLDKGYAVMFYAPRSYTGEDTAELHIHGGAVGTAHVLACVTANGARPAQPGEFTRRAFMNGKLDLTQAEAVCDFISASGAAAARSSMRQLEGDLKNTVLSFQAELTDLLAETEAAVEYPEEDLEPVIAGKALPVLRRLREDVHDLATTFVKGHILKEGLDVVIAGKPNVGKSSLFNALAGVDRSIVSAAAGTTRDTVEKQIGVEGIAINLVDTAGIRTTNDEIENEGVNRSITAVKRSELAIFVLDYTQGFLEEDSAAYNQLKDSAHGVLVVCNKFDLSEGLLEKPDLGTFGSKNCLFVSAKTRYGIDDLVGKIYEYAALADATEGIVITNERHRYLLEKTADSLDDAIRALEEGVDMDCVTIDLNAAWQALGEITGNTVSEEIIDRIFEKFCLGK